jgi:hypothetical protein
MQVFGERRAGMEDGTELVKGSIGGMFFKGHGRASRTFAPDRVCSHDECETRLSIYNEGNFCYLHEPQVAPRVRGRKIA